MIRTVLVLVALTLLAGLAVADEGMWMINRLDQAPHDAWKEAGLRLGPKQIFDPKHPTLSDAIVQVGGGTGSFVSAEGLIVTNHHVAFGALQRQSSVEVNVMEEGFLARKKADEIPAPGYNAYVLKDVQDVTKKVLSKVKAEMSDLERFKAIDLASKTLVEKAESKGDIRADVKEFFDGREFYLYTYFRIKDVRIVYAPPGAIGVYGGEIDNWMWPRHTGDFSFLRAYVGPKGESAEYAEENVPYKPRTFLNFSAAPLGKGDFTMVIGYPGNTSRHRSSFSIDYVVNKYYPDRIQQYGDLINVLQKIGAEDPDAAIKTASTLRSLQNSFKNSQGMLEGLLKYDLHTAKVDQEKALRRYLSDHQEASMKYGHVLQEIASQYAIYTRFARDEAAVTRMVYFTTAMSTAFTIAKWGVERGNEDLARDKGYQDRDEDTLVRRLKLANKRYAEVADKAIVKYYLEWMAAIPATQRMISIEDILKDVPGLKRYETLAEIVDALYANTKVTDTDAALAMFGKTRGELEQMGDPMIDFALRLVDEQDRFEDKSDAFKGAMNRLRPQLLELRAMASEVPLYPDANFSMRVSVGSIEGYSPSADVTYEPFTTLAGMAKKHTGEDPFNVPEKLLMLNKNKDYGTYADPALGDVPVCFLSSDDITGGNSGSPILNGSGNVIGLAFDGNYEAISADYQFIPGLTRAIHVDSRYILFIVDKFAGAKELLDELTIVDGLEGAMR